jgi:hypothetical protein
LRRDENGEIEACGEPPSWLCRAAVRTSPWRDRRAERGPLTKSPAPPSAAGLDALKCRKSEIKDIFPLRARTNRGRRRFGGPSAPSERKMCTPGQRPSAASCRRNAAGHGDPVPRGCVAIIGLDCHAVVANVIVTALRPKYWSWNFVEKGPCSVGIAQRPAPAGGH